MDKNKNRMLELNKFLNEASHKTQQDYFDAQDINSAIDAAKDVIHEKIDEIEYETSRHDQIPSSINVRTLVDKNLNYSKLWKDLARDIEKAYKRGK